MFDLKQVRMFLKSWRNLLALGTLVPLGFWIYSRVWMVNPAILGDEYIYSINSRKAGPWELSPAGDFSNYLFNFVYQGTNLCGEAFYNCGKILNLVFFLGFVFTLFIVAQRFLSFWVSYTFMITAGLSPLSVYTSMFLPESMFMFFIGILLIATLQATRIFSWPNWAIVGATIGLASLVKPHAWLSAIAVVITLLIVGLGQRDVGIKRTSLSLVALVLGAASSRVIVGLAVAGPKALGFFGQYLGADTVETLVTSPVGVEVESSVGSGPLNGIVALFPAQFAIHTLVVTALMALSIVALLSGIYEVIRTRKLTAVTAFGLFTFVWLVSLMIEIVIFTGWVTGGGDDHTTRVLLRYYEFLFVIVPLSGLAILNTKVPEKVNVWLRWMLVGIFVFLLTPAFTGYFSSLTIQIADAPTLAGLVVNVDVFNSVAIVGIISLLIFASFPKLAVYAAIFLLPITLVGTGWQIQDQYQMFRGTLNAADITGQFLNKNFTSKTLENSWILATSRFDATNVAIWADNEHVRYKILPAGQSISEVEVSGNLSLIVAHNSLSYTGKYEETIRMTDYTIYILNN